MNSDQSVTREKMKRQDSNPPVRPASGPPPSDQFDQAQDAQGRLFMYLNELIERCSTIGPRVAPDQTSRDADIPIRAVLEGWDAVGRRYALDPVWGMLRAADESIWRKLCGESERLAILRVVSAMFRVGSHCPWWPLADRFRSVPIRPVRSQSGCTSPVHAPSAIAGADRSQAVGGLCCVVSPQIRVLMRSYRSLSRPGLRERLVLFPDEHCSDNFCALFWSCFRFNWPYRARNAFVRHPPSELYAFSASFNEHFYDLQSWCMTPRFFHAFPDIEADVPIASVDRGLLSSKDIDMPVGRVGPGDRRVPQALVSPSSVAVEFPSMDW